MSEAEIGVDPVNPGIKRALEAEIPDMAIGLQERFLEDVLSVGIGPGQGIGQTQHRLIVLTHEGLKRRPVAAPGSANQVPVIAPAWTLTHPRSPAMRVYLY